MKKLFRHFFVLIVFLILTSCGGITPTTQSDDYPPPFSSIPTLYPISPTEEDSPVISEIPTPAGKEFAVVTGYLKIQKDGIEKPVETGTILYLTEVLFYQGTPAAAGFDRLSPLRTTTDKNGRFVFKLVPLNTYTLILDRVAEAYLLKYPNSNLEIVLEVNSSKIIDLGTLVYENLP
jgi:hypothetical protein|uniref:Carboxypeptidase regulatory-like domain-containing protein n=1 Tax=Bellilinea caldifistulae TaxID=360411 RepID=A0A7C4L0R4_9CHLR